MMQAVDLFLVSDSGLREIGRLTILIELQEDLSH